MFVHSIIENKSYLRVLRVEFAERMYFMFQVGQYIVYGSTGVCEVENTENRSWFLTHLKADLELLEGEGITFISDMQKVLFHHFTIVVLCCDYNGRWNFIPICGC